MREIVIELWRHDHADKEGQVAIRLVEEIRASWRAIGKEITAESRAELAGMLVAAELEMVRLRREERKTEHGRDQGPAEGGGSAGAGQA